MKQPVKPYPQGMKMAGKPVNQKPLKSALNVAKTNPIPIQHLKVEKSHGSALKFKPNFSTPKSL